MANEAQSEVLEVHAEIDEQLRQLRHHWDNFFDISAEACDWGDVGTVKRVRELLSQAIAFLERTEP